MQDIDDYTPSSHGSHDITDEEYRQMRKAEDDQYKPPREKESSDGKTNQSDSSVGYTYSDPTTIDPEKYDEEHRRIRYETDGRHGRFIIPNTSYLRWLPLFYSIPREQVALDKELLLIPRNMKLMLKDPEHAELVVEDRFLLLVMDVYSSAIWRFLKVPDGKDGYKPIPGTWNMYSGNFPMWRMAYMIAASFVKLFEDILGLNLQYLFSMPENQPFPWIPLTLFLATVEKMTEKTVKDMNLQPSIDAVWENRQPEDYQGYNQKRKDFLRTWNHSRNHQHLSFEQMKADGVELADPKRSIEQDVIESQSIEQFKNSLSERDRRILEMRVEGIKLEDIAKAVGYQTASAAKKRIDKIAEEYERFINPSPDDDGIPDI
jgi:hypothetical protein